VIRKTTSEYIQSFAKRGLVAPEGSAFLYDYPSGTLVVRTTEETMEVLEGWSRESVRHSPLNLVFTLRVLEAEGPALRQVVRDAAKQSDQSYAWKVISDLVSQGRARQRETLHLESRSGQRAMLDTGPRRIVATGFALNDKGGVELSQEQCCTSSLLEIDPVVSPDAGSIDVNILLEHHFAPPVERRILAGQSTSLGRVEIPGADFHKFNVLSALTMLDGSTVLLGVWKPQFREEGADPDVLQAAFLRADVIFNLPPANADLAVKLRALADQAEPIVKRKTKHDPVPPSGMKTARFKVPPDFMSMGVAEEVPDPFAGSQTPPPKPPPPSPHHAPLTAKQILEQGGIPFPAGALAAFDPATNELVFTNTQANIDAVEAFTSGIIDGGRPLLIVDTLLVIEADAATLREIAEEGAHQSDHSEALNKLEALAAQGKAKVVSVFRLPGRSGQRVQCQTGTESREMKDFKADDKGRLTATTQTRLAGTSLEVDQVLGPDGWTIEVNFSMSYHYAPPIRLPEAASPAKGVLTIARSPAEFHATSITSAFIIQTGMTRLLGVWKPEGSHEWDGKEVMQAAFLQVNIATVQP